jgi:four helix bundle protein
MRGEREETGSSGQEIGLRTQELGMGTGLHYRRLTVWRKAMDLAKEIYGLVHLLPREELHGIRSQITRAVVSVPTNIAEGWTRESRKEQSQFLSIAQGSLAETETLLSLCEEIGWFPPEKTRVAKELLVEVGKMLTTLRQRHRPTT